MSAKKSGSRKTRQSHQRKPAKKGMKSLRGQPEMYDECKKVITISITPTAITELDKMSAAMNVSRSEFIERIARNHLEA